VPDEILSSIMQNERKKRERRKRIGGPSADGLLHHAGGDARRRLQGLRPGSDTVQEKTNAMNRVNRFRGQAEASERAFEQEIIGCDTSPFIARVRGAIDSLMADVLEDHIRTRMVIVNESRAQRVRL
jgi:DNA-binding FrmR family transcriptional regulator